MANRKLDIAEASERRLHRGKSWGTIAEQKLAQDEAGKGTLALDAINTEIENLSETIANNKTGFENFMKTFDTDTAKGISANIDKMAKGLSAAAKGLTPIPEATAAIGRATASTVELATKAADVFVETDKTLTVMGKALKDLRTKLQTIEDEIRN